MILRSCPMAVIVVLVLAGPPPALSANATEREAATVCPAIGVEPQELGNVLRIGSTTLAVGSSASFANGGSVPRGSTLFTLPPTNLRIASLQIGSRRARVLVRSVGDAVQPVAAILFTDSSRTPNEVRWIPPPAASPAAAEGNLQALEHLYQMVLESPPEQRFTFEPAAAQTAGRRELSYDAVLRVIAEMRECAATELSKANRPTALKHWASVSLDVPLDIRPGPLEAIARARDAAGRPLTERYVSFARGEHLGCTAQTDARGVARCTLWDPHAHSADEHSHEPTVASFGGAVLADRILLPTAKLFRPSTKASAASEQRP